MDTFGVVLFVVSAIVYFVAKNRVDWLAKLSLFTAGAGVGLLAAGIWVYILIDRAFG